MAVMGSDASPPPRRTRRSAPPHGRPAGHAAGPATPGDATDDAEGASEDAPVESVSPQAEVGRPVPTLAEIGNHWPATVDVPTAGAVFGLSRSHSYELIKREEFPAKVVRIGSRYRVLTESIIHVVSDEPPPEPTG